MQLDTLDISDTDDDVINTVYFGGGGITYVFWCDSCKISGYNMQCT